MANLTQRDKPLLESLHSLPQAGQLRRYYRYSMIMWIKTLRQRCLIHKQRNVMSAIPKREQQEVMTDLKGIWNCEKKEDAVVNLTAFKAK